MSLIVFIQVFFVCLFGAMSPGPSMAVVINNAVFKNRYHGVLTSIGHGLGITIYAIFAVIGIGLIINTNILIFNGMKIISIMFLIYLGLKAIYFPIILWRLAIKLSKFIPLSRFFFLRERLVGFINLRAEVERLIRLTLRSINHLQEIIYQYHTLQ